MIQFWPEDIKGRNLHTGVEKRMAVNITKYERHAPLSGGIMGRFIFSFLFCIFQIVNMYQFYVPEQNKCFCFIFQIPRN